MDNDGTHGKESETLHLQPCSDALGNQEIRATQGVFPSLSRAQVLQPINSEEFRSPALSPPGFGPFLRY